MGINARSPKNLIGPLGRFNPNTGPYAPVGDVIHVVKGQYHMVTEGMAMLTFQCDPGERVSGNSDALSHIYMMVDITRRLIRCRERYAKTRAEEEVKRRTDELLGSSSQNGDCANILRSAAIKIKVAWLKVCYKHYCHGLERKADYDYEDVSDIHELAVQAVMYRGHIVL
ncbi:hypothetical protein GMORB2_7777 [Geosmithia morbida]|uniref:Uncharacterized protein n=1 Tax=Geosmithia morbida TaxID=1094350 RepID=A0A9P4YUT8_9HYPO|nr:uncharacterized protein GMORB2_7777 [Geosmithia morbida]KAF4122184.1 hypothetical protein GMORB2_7777 [Geosmithia morbida]